MGTHCTTDGNSVGARLFFVRDLLLWQSRSRTAGSPFTARDGYRNEWTGLTEPRVVQGALEYLEELGWLRREVARARDGGRPSVRFHTSPRLARGADTMARGRRSPKVGD